LPARNLRKHGLAPTKSGEAVRYWPSSDCRVMLQSFEHNGNQVQSGSKLWNWSEHPAPTVPLSPQLSSRDMTDHHDEPYTCVLQKLSYPLLRFRSAKRVSLTFESLHSKSVVITSVMLEIIKPSEPGCRHSRAIMNIHARSFLYLNLQANGDAADGNQTPLRAPVSTYQTWRNSSK
jgi:hypothetical protein